MGGRVRHLGIGLDFDDAGHLSVMNENNDLATQSWVGVWDFEEGGPRCAQGDGVVIV